jgi:Tfp pilus assembly protein PilF
VANITGRLEVMGTFFCGLTWLAWKAPDGRRTWWRVALAGLGFLCALLTKENFVVFPAVMWLADWLTVWRGKTWKARSADFARYAVFGLSLAAYLGMRRLSGETFVTTQAGIPLLLAQLSLWGRFWTMASASLEWYRLLLIGYPLKPIYDPFNMEILTGPNLRAGIGVLLILGLTGWACLSWKKRPGVTFGIGMWFIPLSIVSNIIFPISVVLAERWLYLPSVGYCLIVGFGLNWLATRFAESRLSGRAIAAAVLVAMLVGYSFITARRNPDWGSTLALFSRMTQTDPNHPEGFLQVGEILFPTAPAEARPYIERAAVLTPQSLRSYLLLTRLMLLEGRVGEARKRTDAMLASKPASLTGPSPEWAAVHLVNAELLLREGRKAELKQELPKVLFNAPGIAPYRNRVGEIQFEVGELTDALKTFQDLCRDFPNIPEFHNSLGVVFSQREQFPEARREFEAALRLNPSMSATRSNLLQLEQDEKKKKNP